MSARLRAWLVVVVAAAPLACSSGNAPAPPPKAGPLVPPAAAPTGATNENDPLALIRRLGGRYHEDPNLLEGPVIEVNLRATQLTDADLIALRALPDLRLLDLRETQVTEEGVTRFSSARPKCRVLWK